jgi:tetratricopeptide (TPR) repeat protein
VKYGKAEEMYQKSIEFNHDKGFYYCELAKFYEEYSEYEKSEEMYK